MQPRSIFVLDARNFCLPSILSCYKTKTEFKIACTMAQFFKNVRSLGCS